MTPKLDSL
jgi:hypothetical protein